MAASSKARARRCRPIGGSLEERAHERLEVGEQVTRRTAGRERLGGLRVERPRGVAEHRVVLGLEVVEERARGDAGLLADGLDRDGVEPVLGDEAVGRVDQRLAPRALLALTQPEGGLVDHEFCTRCNFTRTATLHWTHVHVQLITATRSDLAEAALDRRDQRVDAPRRPAVPRSRSRSSTPCFAPSFISSSTLAAFAPLTRTFASYAASMPGDDRGRPGVQAERVAQHARSRAARRRPAPRRRGGVGSPSRGAAERRARRAPRTPAPPPGRRRRAR